jgi:hypothetical protein
MLRRSVVCILTAIAVTSWGNRLQASYTFAKIADTTGSQYSWLSVDGLNNLGTVVFSTQLGQNDYGVYVGNGSSLTQVVRTGDVFSGQRFEMVNRGAVDDLGRVAFTSFQSAPNWTGIRGVFLWNSGQLTQVASESTTEVAINNNSNVAYVGSAPSYSNLCFWDGGTTTTIVRGSDIHGSISFLTMNDTGSVAFSATSERLFTANGNSRTEIIGNSSAFSYLQGHDINNSGTVVFSGLLKAGGFALCEYLNGDTSTLVQTSTSDFTWIGSTAINNLGQIAFTATPNGGSKGIYAGIDPLRDKVVAVGESLDNRVIADIGFAQRLNDSGQLAFWAKFADGNQAIFLASPIPEPSAFVLLVAGAVGLLGYVWRQRCAL